MRRYKKIFILGSGFSKSLSAKMPALKQLTFLLKNENNRNRYSLLLDFIDNIRKLSNDSKELVSIESISNLILGKSFYYNSSEAVYSDYLKNQFLNWLYESLNREAPFIDEDKKDTVYDFIGTVSSVNSNPEPDSTLVMTFNYDLLLERLVEKSFKDKVCIDYIVKLNRYSEMPDSDLSKRNLKRFRYLKLHGSFNWFRSPGGMNYNLNNIYLVNEDDLEKELIHHKDIPVFIPMSSSKLYFRQGSFYNVLWNIAQRYLDLAEEIYFIGYGFPVTDLDNLHFFLRYSNKIRDIVIYEDDATLKNRLENIFTSSSVINSDALDYIKNFVS